MRELWVAAVLSLPVHSIVAVAPPQAIPAPRSDCWPGGPGTDPDACPPDDPRYAERWEFRSDIPAAIDRASMHPAEVELGSIGMSLDRAWQHTIGRDDVVIAVLDSGIRWDDPDLVNKIFLNRGELPVPQGATAHDADGNGTFGVRDYTGDPRVADANANGMLDAQDLIRAFSDCKDDDGNGYPDDISGYDFFGDGGHCGFAAGDNDAADDTDFGHGTGIAGTAAAETNNGLAQAGVCPRCRVLPVRVGDSFVVDGNTFARGTVFSADAGARVIASALGAFNNTPSAAAAVDYAYARGVAVVASAADEFSYHHNFPSVYDHALYVNSIRDNHASDWRRASTFWGVNPCTNFGARVSLAVPARSCSSGAVSRLAGVAGLVASMALDAGFGPLEPEELYQVLFGTADDLDNSVPDWGRLRYPARRGFDQYQGHGRVNALRAVESVRRGAIPPMAELAEPRWFAIVSPARQRTLPISGTIRIPRAKRADWRLEYALGVEPAEGAFVPVASGTVEGEKHGVLGVLDFARLPRPEGPAPTRREERDRYSVTLRLSVIDDRGLAAEARRSFFVLDDPAWKPHFPLDLGASGEASPLVADLDGNGKDEIVLPTADGRLRIVHHTADGLRIVHADLDARAGLPHLPQRETLVRGAVLGDVDADGRTDIVLASREGKVYVFDAAGGRRAGFPVALPPLAESPTPERRVERGVLSRPALADLDGRAGQEIIVSGLDGRLHAWRADGTTLPGFPVTVRHPGTPDRLDKIVSEPALADLDGDGQKEIVVGSNVDFENRAAAFAVHAEGMRHEGGPLLPGWPVGIPTLRPGLLPTIATGVQMQPLVIDADADGDDEILLYSVTGPVATLVDHVAATGPRIVSRYSMVPGTDSAFRGTTFLAGTGSGLLADTDGDGTVELYAPLLPFRMLTLRAKPGIPLDAPLALGGWAIVPPDGGASPRPMLPTFPRAMEDLMIFARPVAADVDGDGRQEVLMGSGGYLLHAFRGAGGEAAGFPKFTGGWIFSAPAVGDLDGDGRLDLVAVTREGYLFAWELRVGEAEHEVVPDAFEVTRPQLRGSLLEHLPAERVVAALERLAER